MRIAHIAIDLCLGNQSCNRVYDNDVHGAGTHHGFADFQSLLTAVRLGNIQVVDIYADVLRIDGIQRMLRVDEAGNTIPLLDLGHHMKSHGSFTTGFRAIDFNNTALGNAAKT